MTDHWCMTPRRALLGGACALTRRTVGPGAAMVRLTMAAWWLWEHVGVVSRTQHLVSVGHPVRVTLPPASGRQRSGASHHDLPNTRVPRLGVPCSTMDTLQLHDDQVDR